MKPNKVSISCDSNPYYLEFWEPVSRMWKHKMGIEPYLFFVGNKQDAPPNHHGIVVTVNPVDGIPIHTQAQWARFHFTQTDLDATWITSDIDMFPLSSFYFVDIIRDIKSDCLVALNTDLRNYFPVCYNIAKGRTFKESLELSPSFVDCVSRVYSSTNSDSHTVNGNTLSNWGADEQYSSKKFCAFRQRYPHRVVQILRPGGFHNGRRIDRINWQYDQNAVKQDWYLDCHSLRPYSKHKNEIETLLRTSLG